MGMFENKGKHTPVIMVILLGEVVINQLIFGLVNYCNLSTYMYPD